MAGWLIPPKNRPRPGVFFRPCGRKKRCRTHKKAKPKPGKSASKQGNSRHARAGPLRIRGEDCGTAAAAPVRHRCGTGAAPVRHRCGSRAERAGTERVRNGCGTGAIRAQKGFGTPAERRRICRGATSSAMRPGCREVHFPAQSGATAAIHSLHSTPSAKNQGA